jgi:quinol monooxygenase YgiN
MSDTALCMRIKCRPGKRDDVKALWEERVKPHAVENGTLLFSCYSFANEDADTIILSEVLDDANALASLYKEDWFKSTLPQWGRCSRNLRRFSPARRY